MSEMAVREKGGLPDTLGELSKFILFGQQKLTAVRAEIHAIRDLKLAKAVEAQKNGRGPDDVRSAFGRSGSSG